MLVAFVSDERYAALPDVLLEFESETAPDLSFEAHHPAAIQGDAAALRMLAQNLAGNAVRHSPEGARVRVTVTGAQLTIEDSGPGIPQSERARVFDRFYRPPGAGEQGSGLGLAIVKAIADRHCARIALGESPLGGLKVTVSFRRDDRDGCPES